MALGQGVQGWGLGVGLELLGLLRVLGQEQEEVGLELEVRVVRAPRPQKHGVVQVKSMEPLELLGWHSQLRPCRASEAARTA
jgi:hypothetical protein